MSEREFSLSAELRRRNAHNGTTGVGFISILSKELGTIGCGTELLRI